MQRQKRVLESDRMIALLDGLTIDAGVASEIGGAYAKGIPVIGLYTDTPAARWSPPEKMLRYRKQLRINFTI